MTTRVIGPRGWGVAFVPMAVLPLLVLLLVLPPGAFPEGVTGNQCINRCDAGEYCDYLDCKDCFAGTYQSAVEHRYTECLECKDSEFQPSEGQSQCLAKQTCNAGEFISTDGSATADRKCKPCRTNISHPSSSFTTHALIISCPPRLSLSISLSLSAISAYPPPPVYTGSYSVEENQPSCLAWTICPDGYVPVQQGTPTSDVVCSSCPYGKYQPDPDDDTCVDWQLCGVGEMWVKGSNVRDARCRNCSTGYQLRKPHSQTSCERWTQCPPGTYVSVPGTPTRDRQCADCGEGTFTLTYNAPACDMLPGCSPGFYYAGPPSANSGTYCRPCPEDTFISEYNHNRTECTEKRVCDAGYGWTDRGPTADAVCTECIEGKFQGSQGHREPCSPWLSCPAGEQQSQAYPPSTTRDRECVSCPHMSYRSGDTDEPLEPQLCQPWSLCGPGTAYAPGTAETDSNCSPCPDGKYQPQDNHQQRACMLWSKCGPEEAFVKGSTTEDATCVPCEVGMYQDKDGHQIPCTAATVCAPGEFITASPSLSTDRACASCANGTYTDTSNAYACAAWSSCGAGNKWAPGTPSTDATCAPCPQTTYMPHSNHRHAACLPHTLRACGPGSYIQTEADSTTDRVCSSCPPGTYQDELDRTSCKRCGFGTASDATGATTSDACAPCESGFYQKSAGQPTCLPCPEGSAQKVTGSSFCDMCLPGFYQNEVGQTACKPCPENTFANDAGRVECTACSDCPEDMVVVNECSRTSDRACSTLTTTTTTTRRTTTTTTTTMDTKNETSTISAPPGSTHSPTTTKAHTSVSVATAIAGNPSMNPSTNSTVTTRTTAAAGAGAGGGLSTRGITEATTTAPTATTGTESGEQGANSSGSGSSASTDTLVLALVAVAAVLAVATAVVVVVVVRRRRSAGQGGDGSNHRGKRKGRRPLPRVAPLGEDGFTEHGGNGQSNGSRGCSNKRYLDAGGLVDPGISSPSRRQQQVLGMEANPLFVGGSVPSTETGSQPAQLSTSTDTGTDGRTLNVLYEAFDQGRGNSSSSSSDKECDADGGGHHGEVGFLAIPDTANELYGVSMS